MTKNFLVRLTLYYRDGKHVTKVVPISQAITWDRALKNGDPLPDEEVVDLYYTTLKELPE